MEELFSDLAGLEVDLPFSDKVEGLKAELIWQFLRFNKNYQKSYDRLKIEAANDDSGDLPQLFAKSWCLSTAVDYSHEILPKELYNENLKNPETGAIETTAYDLTPFFKYSPFLTFKNKERLEDWGDLILPDGDKITVLNPYASREQVLRYLAKQPPSASESIRGLRKKNFVDYIVCHYYCRIKGLGPTELGPIYHRIFGSDRTDALHTNTINGHLEGFDQVSARCPWCFFTPPHR